MKIFEGETFADVYRSSLIDLISKPDYHTSPRGLNIKENVNTSLKIHDPTKCMFSNIRRSTVFKYISAEFLYYYLGRNDSNYISQYAKMWDKIKNEDGTINSAYGKLIFNNINEHKFTQYDWAFTSLVNDINTRQAILHFNLPVHQNEKNKDFVCTMYGMFLVRDNKLNFTIHMRSNDAILGTPTDVPFFCSLQMQMLSHLKSFYPDLELGSYTHYCNSYHVYEQHYDLVKEMIDNEFIPIGLPPIKNDLIDSKGTPSPELITVNDFIHYPTSKESLYFHDRDDLLYWILSNLKPNLIVYGA